MIKPGISSFWIMNQAHILHWLFLIDTFDTSKEYVLHTVTVVLEIQLKLFEREWF
jgi:hypothetical protein